MCYNQSFVSLMCRIFCLLKTQVFSLLTNLVKKFTRKMKEFIYFCFYSNQTFLFISYLLHFPLIWKLFCLAHLPVQFHLHDSKTIRKFCFDKSACYFELQLFLLIKTRLYFLFHARIFLFVPWFLPFFNHISVPFVLKFKFL